MSAAGSTAQTEDSAEIISSGRTHLSKSSGDTTPSSTAASFRVLPSACAFFAAAAALS